VDYLVNIVINNIDARCNHEKRRTHFYFHIPYRYADVELQYLALTPNLPYSLTHLRLTNFYQNCYTYVCVCLREIERMTLVFLAYFNMNASKKKTTRRAFIQDDFSPI